MYSSLREFLNDLERRRQLVRVAEPVNPHLEMTELSQRSLRAKGPALLFEHPTGSRIQSLGNLFGSVDRVMAALGLRSSDEICALGRELAALKEPSWPQRPPEFVSAARALKPLLHATPRRIDQGAFDECVLKGDDVDLGLLPIWHCWPEDAAKLIVWGLTITKGPHQSRQNIGVYRQQVIARNRVIMRWLPHRGGAQDYREWRQLYPSRPFPVAVALGADPATTLAAVAPIPDSLSEFQFAGLLRGARSCVVANEHGLLLPASAEIVLEGVIHPNDTAIEGPFGDHTGYYNARGEFPVFTVERMRMRAQPIYHGGYLGRAPFDEPSVIAMALNELFVPILQRVFPEIVDFYLPPEACSYRVAVVSIRKGYPGHARRIMQAVWSYLRQFTYTKFVIVVDDDIDARNFSEVIWALSTRVDPARDTLIVKHTPMDYLDFASVRAGLGSKLGIDATNKWPGETRRTWGKPLRMSDDVVKRVDALWSQLKLDGRSPAHSVDQDQIDTRKADA